MQQDDTELWKKKKEKKTISRQDGTFVRSYERVEERGRLQTTDTSRYILRFRADEVASLMMSSFISFGIGKPSYDSTT